MMIKPFNVNKPVETRLTKRNFWNRFPQTNLTAMQAILRSGAPALLAGRLSVLQLLVSESPFVDISLPQTASGVQSLASADFPTTVDIDGVTLPLRLTQIEVDVILSTPTEDEVYRD